jgi:hypothetical protein
VISSLVERRIAEDFACLLTLGYCGGDGVPIAQHDHWRAEIRRLARAEKLRIRTGVSQQGGEDNHGMPFAVLIDFDGISPEQWNAGMMTLRNAAEVIRHFNRRKHLRPVEEE